MALAGFLPWPCASATLPRPAVAAGAFILDGSTNPSQVSGIVESVRRLVDATPLPFFRVRFNTRLPLRALTTMIVPHVRGTDITDELTSNIVDITADPAAERDDNFEIDIVVSNAGTAVDTAGFRVDLEFHFARERPVDVT